MEALILTIALSANESANTRHHRCDLIEINHCADNSIDQVILWNFWGYPVNRFIVRDWRMQKGMVYWSHARGCAVWLFRDPKNFAPREVRGDMFSETWTYEDREVENRKILKPGFRDKLEVD